MELLLAPTPIKGLAILETKISYIEQLRNNKQQSTNKQTNKQAIRTQFNKLFELHCNNIPGGRVKIKHAPQQLGRIVAQFLQILPQPKRFKRK